MRDVRIFLLAALSLVLCFGCRKEDPAPSGSSAPATPATPAMPSVSGGETIARIHWLGKKRLAAETNAAGFMQIWNEPESARLEAHALDKFSLAPWRLLRGETGTNAASSLLRPLLDDAVREESYLEVCQSSNAAGALAFAVRLDDTRAALWETNLATALESLTGIHPVASGARRGWVLKKHHLPDLLELTRAGEWTILGAGHETNALLADFVARIQHNGAPFFSRATNFWLEADVDLSRVQDGFSLNWQIPPVFPKTALTVIGVGADVRANGGLTFSRPLSIALEEWNLPTNLIRETMASFTAVRGFAPWLASRKEWTDLQIGSPPNQFFVWSGQGIPMQTLFAASMPNATNRMPQLNRFLWERVNPWLNTNGAGRLEQSPNSNGVVWAVPFMGPFLRPAGDFVMGGFFPGAFAKRVLPTELRGVLSQTNIIYYDWEITGPRIEAWLEIGQLLRVLLQKAQLPFDSASMSFLRSNTNNFGNSVTIVSQSGPEQLSFVRESSVGFTAIELHLLADWLESPQFPIGLNTFIGREPSLKNRRPPRPPVTPPAPPSSPQPPK